MSRRGSAKNLGRADAFQIMRAETLKNYNLERRLETKLAKAKNGKLYKTAQANKNYISGFNTTMRQVAQSRKKSKK